MKKLILITCLSFLGIIASDVRYPYIAKHYPPESRVPKQCEENDPARWGEEKFTDIAIRCTRLDITFPWVVNSVAPIVGPLLITIAEGSIRLSRTEGSLESLIKKRKAIKKIVFAKRNIEPVNSDVDAILSSLNLSEYDRRKEKEYVKTYLLFTAEQEVTGDI